MTPPANELLSHLAEVVVLARLGSGGRPAPKAIAKTVETFVQGGAKDAVEKTNEALRSLYARGYITDRPKAKRSRTEAGLAALRLALGVERIPPWMELTTLHLPALSLGLSPSTRELQDVLKDGDTLRLHLLRTAFTLPAGQTLGAVCDQLIRERLGIAEREITLDIVRASVLATHLRSQPATTPGAVARQVIYKQLAAIAPDKPAMLRALTRRWLYEKARAIPVSQKSLGPGDRNPVAATPSLLQSAASIRPRSEGTNSGTEHDDQLLMLVRDALPRIGSDGRFGTEKVFVSALWRTISSSAPQTHISLEHFKSWLVSANRQRLLDLAPADLVGAMDARLVAESKIEHRGATFHFVIDHRPTHNNTGGAHA